MGSVGWKRGDAVSIAICCAALPGLECLSLIHHDRVSDLLFIGIFVLDSSRDISVQTYGALLRYSTVVRISMAFHISYR